jgi:hypothetical protein
MYLIFRVSEAQIEPHDVTGVPPINPEQPAQVVIGPVEFAQITYGTLRAGDMGEDVAYVDGETGFWTLKDNLLVSNARHHDGSNALLKTTTENMTFTDIIFSDEDN